MCVEPCVSSRKHYFWLAILVDLYYTTINKLIRLIFADVYNSPVNEGLKRSKAGNNSGMSSHIAQFVGHRRCFNMRKSLTPWGRRKGAENGPQNLENGFPANIWLNMPNREFLFRQQMKISSFSTKMALIIFSENSIVFEIMAHSKVPSFQLLLYLQECRVL